MTDFSRPSQWDFIATMQRLHAAQLNATTPDEREMADHELQRFLMLAGNGRAAEWYESGEKP